MHLIYETEEEAIARADKCGQHHNLSYWQCGTGTRWISAPEVTIDNKWSLSVDCYDLSDEEQEASENTEDPVFPENNEEYGSAIEEYVIPVGEPDEII